MPSNSSYDFAFHKTLYLYLLLDTRNRFTNALLQNVNLHNIFHDF